MLEKLYKNEYERTRELVQAPDWYLEFKKVRQIRLVGLAAVQAALAGNVSEAANYAKHLTANVFERLLSEGAVRIGIPGRDELDDQDEDREPITQIVIHHSSRKNGISLAALNALHFLTLYVPVYQNTNRPVLTRKGEHQPIYSGHFSESGQQVFYGYHWKVNQNGTATRLLDDTAIGWHAGNWEVNKRSIGICIDDDTEFSRPTLASIEAVATIISEQYAHVQINNETLVGHGEVTKSATSCPGSEFLLGWKQELLNRIGQ